MLVLNAAVTVGRKNKATGREGKERMEVMGDNGEGDEVILKKSAATRPARCQRPRADPGHQLVTLGEL